jgi:adenosylcobinamide kinase/adenosylcobinamide-phosphate guanylyltransferase
MAGDANLFHQERVGLLAALPAVAGRIILVSNETSMGVIPAGELSRRFCDEAGRLHQDIAQVSDNVILTVAGLPHVLKGEQP